jgi:uncharacterized protein involved in type VI secretion and phage assembly
MIADAGPRETMVEAGGYVKGVATATVQNNKDPDGMGRVKVSYPWHSKPSESYWARIAVPMAGKDRGAYFLPEVGDEVIVAFERGDLAHPCIVGSVWNGVDTTPGSNSDGKNDVRMIKSRKGHLLVFDDGTKGSLKIQLNDGKKVIIDDDGIRMDDTKGNSLTIASSDGTVTLAASGALKLKGATVSIESQGTLDLKATAALTVQGLTVSIN